MRESSIWAYIRRRSLLISAALLIVATIRIAATYPVFNHIADEPGHIACGLEWLERGVYRFEHLHPPLARIAVAVGPYLDGALLPPGGSMYLSGLSALQSGNYWRRLALARIGILPFLWIAGASVFLWARRYYGDEVAVLAVLFFTLLPPVLAHAGVATTDMALAAFTIAAFYAALRFAECPGIRSGLLFGATTALAVLSKFSALAFVPVSVGATALVYVCLERRRLKVVAQSLRRWVLPLALAAGLAGVLVWVAYRFSYGPVKLGNAEWRLPAPEFYQGISQFIHHIGEGHPAYLLGRRSLFGWWYYYPVMLAVKTPLAFLFLLASGVFIAVRRVPKGWIPLVFSASLLIFCLFNTINLGVRHILSVYAGFSIAAALGAHHLLRGTRRWVNMTGVALIAWLGLTSLLSHPDYLAYTNELAGDEPERILDDTDLDWGQDMSRLGRRLAELGVHQLTLSPFIGADYSLLGLPPLRPSDPLHPAPGWNAVSITLWKSTRFGLWDRRPDLHPWPDLVKPRERIGKGMLLYYFPFPPGQDVPSPP